MVAIQDVVEGKQWAEPQNAQGHVNSIEEGAGLTITRLGWVEV
jgi:hypothetical protein